MNAQTILALPHVAQNLPTMPSAERAALWLSQTYNGVTFKPCLKALQRAMTKSRDDFERRAMNMAHHLNMSWVQAMCTMSADILPSNLSLTGAA